MIASIFALEKRLELFVAANVNPDTNDQYQIERIVSYDNGETWVNNWIRNEIGTFSSSAAACITGDSLDTFLVAKGRDNKAWFSRLQEYYEFKNSSWGPIGAGVFTGKPAICSYGNSSSGWKLGSNNKPTVETSYNGIGVMVFAKGNDRRIWWAFSKTGGLSWDMAWAPIGEGTFLSSPAAACSADGKLVAVFARGQDDKIWWAFSTNKTSSWDMAWSAIPAGKFTSAPAAVCSADGKRIYVFSKGTDNKIWWAFATNGVQKWDMAWAPIGEGVFTSMASANCSWDGKMIHVFAKGTDNRVWQARSNDFGATWNIAWRKIHTKQFIHTDN
jgi:ABC-type transporter Mla maintaining outer membrane lipid asymmetry permease subunit MlaE